MFAKDFSRALDGSHSMHTSYAMRKSTLGTMSTVWIRNLSRKAARFHSMCDRGNWQQTT